MHIRRLPPACGDPPAARPFRFLRFEPTKVGGVVPMSAASKNAIERLHANLQAKFRVRGESAREYNPLDYD